MAVNSRKLQFDRFDPAPPTSPHNQAAPVGDGRLLLDEGTDIRTVQDLLGHVDVATTQIFLHVMKGAGVGVRSPLDH